jgi:opacity protein-like surface antigen
MTGSTSPGRTCAAVTSAFLAALSLAATQPAHASNLFNFYLGAAYARSNLRAQDSAPLPFGGRPLNSFDRSDSGYQLSLGVRALDLLGAEVDYFDLGNGGVSNAHTLAGGPGVVTNASLAQKGEAVFALLYLPVPVVDLYLKAGMDRITSDLGARFTPQGLCVLTRCTVESLALHATTTGLALGAGVQWKFGDWGLRAEYDRFSALGKHPDMVSMGVTWTIL